MSSFTSDQTTINMAVIGADTLSRAARTRIRGLQGVSAATAGNILFKNTSVTGTTLLAIPTSTSTTDLIEPYVPDNGILFKAGAYISLPSGVVDTVTVFYDG